ncbi:MAG: DUF2961 domain-containing protein [Candidatus Omnitrophota bacterium]
MGRLFLLFFPVFLISAAFDSAFGAEETKISFSTLIDKTSDINRLFLDPDAKVEMFSSYDRQGGNRDDGGFLRQEGDWYVIAEMQGPGAITRLWSANPQGMIRIFVDKGGEPLIQRSFQDLFLNKFKPFIKPFVYAGSDPLSAHWSYIPIPYKQFCKIAIDKLCFYQIEYETFSKNAPVVSMAYPISKEEETRLDNAAKNFVTPEKPPIFTADNIKEQKIKATIPAGETIDLATITGPAILLGFRMKWTEGSVEIGRDLMLKTFWDEEKYPSIVSPAGDFFADRVKTLALGQEKNGWRFCYLPMPFHTQARFQLTNGHLQNTYQAEAVLTYQEKANLPQSLSTFHAYWTRDNDTPVPPLTLSETNNEPVCDPSENYTALSARGRGSLMGVYMVRTPSPESDAMIFVDRFSFPPSLHGCGKEGFFDQGGSVITSNWPLAAGASDFNGMDAMLRLFLPAPIRFSESLDLTFEHGTANALRQDYASTVYWYQEEPHQRFSWPLPIGGRYFRKLTPIQSVIHFQERQGEPESPLEAETLWGAANGGVFESQEMLAYGPDWSRNQQIRFEAFKEGASCSFDAPPLLFSGLYKLECALTHAPDGAQIDLRVNGETVLPAIDLYAEHYMLKRYVSPFPLFLHTSSQPRISVHVLGSHPDAKGLTVGIDYFQFKPTILTPSSLLVDGPFALNADSSDYPAQKKIATQDGDPLFLGYAKEPHNASREILPDSKTASFNLGGLIAEAKLKEGLCFVTWKIKADYAGIYRFEVAPESSSPFLLRQISDKMEILPKTMLWNGILIHGEDAFRFDPSTNQAQSQRFHIPLDSGESRISWLVRCNAETRITPKLFGL